MENKTANNIPMANGSKKEFVVNYHMNELCNYSCEYCYAKWGIGDLRKEIHNDLKACAAEKSSTAPTGN